MPSVPRVEVIAGPAPFGAETARFSEPTQLVRGILAKVPWIRCVGANALIGITSQSQLDAFRERGGVRRLQHEKASVGNKRTDEGQHELGRGVQMLDYLRHDDDVVPRKVATPCFLFERAIQIEAKVSAVISRSVRLQAKGVHTRAEPARDQRGQR